MANAMTAAAQFASRPMDQRFASLLDLQDFTMRRRRKSAGKVLSSRALEFMVDPARPHTHLYVQGSNSGAIAEPTHWSFGQLAQLAGAPAGYLRGLAEKGLTPLVADCLNAGLKIVRDVEDIGVLLTNRGDTAKGNMDIEIRAATGPNYGRIWDHDVVTALVQRFGDGVTGDWRVPGMFGKPLAEVTKANTTLYASDRDCFVFLADEVNRIEMANRRPGLNGSTSLARGFFTWNSEVGSSSIGGAFFLFDYVCENRIVWGMEGFEEIRLRHTVSAPDRWLSEIEPTLIAYANSMASPIEARLAAAQQTKIDDLDKFFASRQFTRKDTALFKQAHVREEGRPIETLWDAVTAVTAHAKTIPYQDDRVAFERAGGKILDLVPRSAVEARIGWEPKGAPSLL